MTLAQPTPGPWIIWRLSPDSDQQQRVIITTADGEQEITGIVASQADARHILLCVNHHEELVQALEQIRHHVENTSGSLSIPRAALNAIDAITERTLLRVYGSARAAHNPGSSPLLPPDPEGMNDKRAAWAARAINAFQKATGTDEEDALCDLLADLMHWADRANFDFEAALIRGRDHYEAETSEEQP